MAEENNLENEFDKKIEEPNDLNSLDSLDNEAGFDQLDNQSGETEKSASTGLFKQIVKNSKVIFSSRRNQIIFGILLVFVITLSVFLFTSGKSKSNSKKNSGLVQAESPTFDGSSIVQKKKPNKKKKKASILIYISS